MRQPIPFGKYLLLDRISVGGMAEVFKAKSYGVEGFEKVIAIKRILPSMGEDRDFIKMFIDEAKIVGQLAHANICQIFELGRTDGAHFIAMEYIWGKDLLQVQNRLRKLKLMMPAAMACFVVAKVCEGLDYAHKRRDALGRPLEIVHRDCSPQNVLISYEGEVKLIDFGIAKAASRSSRTQAGVLKGKFGYMSPEQVRGLPLDRRSDLFSVGTILYECLTGDRLFVGETDFSTLEKVRNVDVPRPRQINPAIPEEVERIIMKALAKDADARYQWASEMVADLHQFLMTQDQVFTAKSLSAWLKESFAAELERERQQLESFKKVGREGLIAGKPAAEAKLDVVEHLGVAGAPEGDPTMLGGPSFLDDEGATINTGGGPPPALRGRDHAADFAEEQRTEIFGEIGDGPPRPGRPSGPQAASRPEDPTIAPLGLQDASLEAALAIARAQVVARQAPPPAPPPGGSPPPPPQRTSLGMTAPQPQPPPTPMAGPPPQPGTAMPKMMGAGGPGGVGPGRPAAPPAGGRTMMAMPAPMAAGQGAPPHGGPHGGPHGPVPGQPGGPPPGYGAPGHGQPGPGGAFAPAPSYAGAVPGGAGAFAPQPSYGGQGPGMSGPYPAQPGYGAPVPPGGSYPPGAPMQGGYPPGAPMQGGYPPGAPMQGGGYPPGAAPGQQQGYYVPQLGMFGPSSGPVPHAPVEPTGARRRRPSLMKDVLIGVGIAALVLGGFAVVKFVVLADKSTQTAAAETADAGEAAGAVAAVAPIDAAPPVVAEVVDAGAADPAAIAAADGDAGTADGAQVAAVEPAADAGTGTDVATAGAAAGTGAGTAGATAGTAAGSGAGTATTSPPAGDAARLAAAEPPADEPPAARATTPPPPRTEPKPARTEPKPVRTEPKPARTEPKPRIDTAADRTETPAGADGYLTASTTPWAQLAIDGVPTGKMTPITLQGKIPLKPGKHKLTFTVGREPFHYTVKIEAGKTLRFNKVLPVGNKPADDDE